VGNGHFLTCSVCMRERPGTTGRRPVLKKHRRWHPGKGEMVPCEGSGRKPLDR